MSGVDLATSNLQLRVLSAHLADQFNCVAWSPDGTSIATASNDRTIRIWEANTGTLQRTLAGYSDTVTSVTWSPDGKLLASGAADRSVWVWEAGSGHLQRTHEGHTGAVTSVFSHPLQLPPLP